MKIYAVVSNRWMPDSAFDLTWCKDLAHAEQVFEEESKEAHGIYPVVCEMHEFDAPSGESSILKSYSSCNPDEDEE